MEINNKILNVTITGACGRISFELLPLLCNGLVFGLNQKISLNLYGKKINNNLFKIHIK